MTNNYGGSTNEAYVKQEWHGSSTAFSGECLAGRSTMNQEPSDDYLRWWNSIAHLSQELYPLQFTPGMAEFVPKIVFTFCYYLNHWWLSQVLMSLDFENQRLPSHALFLARTRWCWLRSTSVDSYQVIVFPVHPYQM